VLKRSTMRKLPLLLLFLLVPAPARAAEDRNARARAEGAPVALEGSAGMGAPLGWLGAEAVLRASPWTDLHGGAGLGTEGLQVGAGLRGRAPLSRYTSLTIGASWSSGRFVAMASFLGLPEMDRPSPPMRYFSRANFVNFDVGVETSDRGFRTRPFLGLGMVVDPSDGVLTNATCDARSCPMKQLIVVPYIGAAFALPVL
jgi:hypothetical protein